MDTVFREKLLAIVDRMEPRFQEETKREVLAFLEEGVSSIDDCLLLASSPKADRNLRKTACWVLGNLREKKATDALLTAFMDADPDLSLEAAKALGIIRDKRAVPPVITALLGAEDVSKRTLAAYTLGLVRDKRTVEPLLGVLVNAAEDPKVRSHAAEALAQLGDHRAVDVLIESLNDASVDVRFWSAFALGSLGDRRALPELRRLAENDKAVLPGWWSIREEAEWAIDQILNS